MDQETRKAYIKQLETEVERERESLAPLEGGQTHMQQRRAGEAWRDVTTEIAEEHRQNIRLLESIIAALKKAEVP